MLYPGGPVHSSPENGTTSRASTTHLLLGETLAGGPQPSGMLPLICGTLAVRWLGSTRKALSCASEANSWDQRIPSLLPQDSWLRLQSLEPDEGGLL